VFGSSIVCSSVLLLAARRMLHEALQGEIEVLTHETEALMGVGHAAVLSHALSLSAYLLVI